jgi:hypothetical protein
MGMDRPMNFPNTPGSLKRALRFSPEMAATYAYKLVTVIRNVR